MLTQVHSFVKRQRGGGLVEYSLILVLIAMVAVAALNVLGTNVNTMITNVASALP